MTEFDPLVRRDELTAQFGALIAKGTDIDAQLASIRQRECPHSKGAPKPLASSRRLAELRVAQARGEATSEDVLDAQLALDEITSLIEELVQAAGTASRARRAVQADLAKLHVEHRDAFAAEAEKASRAAHDALTALKEPYEQAWQLWLAARDAWAPLVRAVPDLTHVPQPPLRSPMEAFTGAQAVPPELAAPVASPESPPVGSIRIWGHDSGATEGAQVGTQRDAIFAADPNWRLLEVRPGEPPEPKPSRGIPMTREPSEAMA